VALGNIARSRLSGGSCSVSTRPPILFWRGRQTGFHWILLYVSSNAIEFLAISDQTIKAFFLPKWSVSAEEDIGLVSRKTLKGTKPAACSYVRRN